MSGMTTSPAPLRVLGYARISRETEESTSLDKQADIIRAHAERHGHVLVDIISESVSASTSRLDRPGLSEVRRRVASGDATAVLVWRLDRLARNVVDMGTLLDEGLAVISATEPLDTASPMGRAMVEVLQVFARLEAKTIGLRVASSISHLKRVGRWSGGLTPYGYRSAPHPDGVGRTLVLDADEARVIREVADRALSGESLHTIARDLNERGLVTRTGKAWRTQTLRRMLTGDALLGRATDRGALVRDEHGLPVAHYPEALPLADVERLRALFPASRPGDDRRGKGRRKASRLASGLLACSSCGGGMRVTTNGAGARSYRCNARAHGLPCAEPVSIAADGLDEHLAETFLGAVGWMPETRAEERVVDAPDLAAVEEALRTTAEEMVRPGADLAALGARLAGLHAQREALAAAPPERRVEMVSTGRTFAEAWEAATTDERRAMLSSALVGPVVISRGARGRNRHTGPDSSRVSAPWTWLAEDMPDPAWSDDYASA